MVDGSLGKHGVVLDLGLAEGRGVGRDENELGLARAHVLEGALKAEGDLTRLDDKLELGVDVVLGRLLSLGSHFSVELSRGGALKTMGWLDGKGLKEGLQ